MAKLFISYSHADSAIVNEISKELQEAGHEVWIDTFGIQGGTLWGSEIAKAIMASDVFLLFVSATSVRSDYVRREVDIAFHEKRKMLPIRLEKVETPVEWDYALAGIQYINYQAPDWKPRLLIALGSQPVPKTEKDTGKLKNPYSSLPILEPIERLLILSNREAELKRGLEHLNNHRLLLVNGMPGIGKSTFARALLEFKPPDSPPPFWYNFERQRSTGNSLGVLLDQLSSYLDMSLDVQAHREVMAFRNEPGGTASVNNVDALISFLNRDKPIWLVFDNLETVLSRDTYEFLDDGLELLFDSLKSNAHNAKIIVTNPFVPVLKSGELFLEAGSEPLILEGLNDEFTFAFLRAYGLQNHSKEELEPLIREINGHPFVLNHIARHIQIMGSSIFLEDLPGGLEEVNQRFGEFLEERLSSQEFNALRSLTILNREVSLGGLCQIAQVRQNIVMRLREKGLLQANDAGKFWLHNIVRSSLKPIESDQLRQAHVRAMNFYRRQESPLLPQNIEDYANVLEWHHHAVEASDAVSAYSALYYTALKDQLMQWNEYELVVRLCERTLSAVYRVESDITKIEANLSDSERLDIYHTLGIACFLLGDLKRSTTHLESAVKLLPSEGEAELRIKLLIDLSESYNGNGDTKSAMALCDQLWALLAGWKNDALQAKFLHLRGIIHRDSHELDAAKRDLEEAQQLYHKLSDFVHLGNAMIDLGAVYFFQNRFKEAEASYRRAIISFESQRYIHGIIKAHYNIADIFLQEEKYESAREEILPAVELARQGRFANLELRARFILAESQIALSLLDESETELTQIRELIKKQPFSCFSGQELLLLAVRHAKHGYSDQAMTYFVRAFDYLRGSDCKYERARGHLLFAAFLKNQNDLKRAEDVLLKAKELFTDFDSQLGLQATERALQTLWDS